jgi:hypothetical protein
LFTISDEEETGLSDWEIAGVIVGAFGFIALCIALGCIYKKRQHICKRRQDGNESNASINLFLIPFQKILVELILD